MTDRAKTVITGGQAVSTVETTTKAAPVSVVVAVHGNTTALRGLLQSLTEQDYSSSVQVVVVDNHRRRHVAPSALTDAGLTGVVIHEPRLGLSRARNTGLQHAQGTSVLFTDPDSRPEPGWVRELVAALESTGAACAGGRIVPRFPAFTRPPRIAAGVAQFFVPPAWPERTCSLQAPFWVAGCNLALRTGDGVVFDEWLGARPRRHLSCEDVELTIRAQQTGHTVVVAPDAVVHRAIHPRDLRLSALVARGFWHGVSVARMRRRHPGGEIYDSLRVRDVLGAAGGGRGTAMHLARVVGWRLERLRLVLQSTPARTVAVGGAVVSR